MNDDHRSWIDNHADYATSDEIPLYGIRAVAVLDEAGNVGYSFAIDGAETLNPFELAGFLSKMQQTVLAETAG